MLKLGQAGSLIRLVSTLSFWFALIELGFWMFGFVYAFNVKATDLQPNFTDAEKH